MHLNLRIPFARGPRLCRRPACEHLCFDEKPEKPQRREGHREKEIFASLWSSRLRGLMSSWDCAMKELNGACCPNTGARSSSTAATSERAFLFEFHQVILIDHSAFPSFVGLGNTPFIAGLTCHCSAKPPGGGRNLHGEQGPFCRS